MLQAMKRNSFHLHKRYMLYFYEKKNNTGQIEYFVAWIICNDYAEILIYELINSSLIISFSSSLKLKLQTLF